MEEFTKTQSGLVHFVFKKSKKTVQLEVIKLGRREEDKNKEDDRNQKWPLQPLLSKANSGLESFYSFLYYYNVNIT